MSHCYLFIVLFFFPKKQEHFVVHKVFAWSVPSARRPQSLQTGQSIWDNTNQRTALKLSRLTGATKCKEDSLFSPGHGTQSGKV